MILVALLAGLASVGCTPGSMSERKFTQVYADSLRGAFPDADFKIIDNLEIEGTAGELTYQHFLDNAYNDYTRSPEEIIPIIQRYLASSLSPYRNNGAIVGLSVENIVPVKREKAFASDMHEAHVSLLAKAYNDEVITCYAQDSETSRR